MNLEGIDKTLESKVRLGIMSVLAVNDSVDFVTLKSLLELTDGNLVTHLRNLANLILPTPLLRKVWRLSATTWRPWRHSSARTNAEFFFRLKL